MDGGANICVTGDLLTMVGAVDIPPMAILVAIDGTDIPRTTAVQNVGTLLSRVPTV
jgi:hypothetical protein